MPSEVENDDGAVKNKSSVSKGQVRRRSRSSISSSSSSLSLVPLLSPTQMSRTLRKIWRMIPHGRCLNKSSLGGAKDDTEENYLLVSIDLGLSTYANASEYFTAKKTSAEKKKIETKIGEAMKNIEAKIEAQLNENSMSPMKF